MIRTIISTVSFVAAVLYSSAAVGQAGDAAGADTSAERLAREVVERTGDPRDVERLAFSFIVEVDGEQKARRRHVWWPREGKLKVTYENEKIVLKDLHERDLTRMAQKPEKFADAWSAVAKGTPPEAAADAWSHFINDSYWLLAPAKLLDAGVQRRRGDDGDLILTFQGVGLTPGDRYELTVDEERNVVTSWKFELQSGRTGAFRWTDYETFGPLYLSTRRTSIRGDRDVVIRFTDVEVVPR